MLFLNISSDKVHIADEHQELFLERNGIENTLGPTLIKRKKETGFESVFLLNGPGGFTNLRVGTLTLNLLNSLQEEKIHIYSITKIELFKKLHDTGFLPRYGMIYIGQTNNVRYYDLKNGSYEKIGLDKVRGYDSVFMDYVHGDYRPQKEKMLSFEVKKEGIFIKYGKKKQKLAVKKLEILPQTAVKPEYFIQAIN